MSKSRNHQSRRTTPWDGHDALTPTQHFLSERYEIQYKERHPRLTETGEAALINAIMPDTCPSCQHHGISRFGPTGNGMQRYRCKGCGKTFTPITGTIFDGHKISISEWMEDCLNIFRYVSINADSWNNRNAFTTSRYWLEKLFLGACPLIRIMPSVSTIYGTVARNCGIYCSFARAHGDLWTSS